MRRPRLLALVSISLLAATACGGETPSRATPSATSVITTVPTATMSTPATSIPETSAPPDETPTPEGVGSVRVPAGAPITYGPDVDASDVPLTALAPTGARIGSTWLGEVTTRSRHATSQAIVLSWSGGDPMAPESGLEVWHRWDTTTPPAWRVVFAFTDRPRSGVLGVRFEIGDVTHDRSPDVVSFESLGGSGACGIWRVVLMNVEANEEIYHQQTCDTDVRIVGKDLAMREAVYAPDDAHCCPSSYQTTTLEWTGDRWTVVSRTTEPA